MPDSIGTAFVDVAFDPKQISGQMGGVGGKLSGGFAKLGGVWGAAAATGFGAAIVAAVAAGKYLYDIGGQFDDMADTIRVSTGKTGKELDALVKTAKQVGTDVPASFADAGKAVGFLSTRLGLTGKPLRGVSDQILELSRLTGTDLQTNLNVITRMLGDAGMKGADASKGIDMLWRAAEATQVPIGRLAELITKYGGPMRQLGFSFEEQAALLGKFEKEGVNTELVMGSMRIALGKMAKAGKDPQRELRKVMEEIKGAGDAGKANAKAIELFGARAGPDMAAAIREGRFEIADLQKQIAGGGDTVMKASKDTADFSEQWAIFKNRIAVGLAPLASGLFNAIGVGMKYVNQYLPPLISGLRDGLAPIVKELGPLFTALGGALVKLAPVFKVALDVAIAFARGIGQELKGLAQIIGGVLQIITSLLTGDWKGAWDGAKQVVKGFTTMIKGELAVMKSLLTGYVRIYAATAKLIGGAIRDGITAPLRGLGALVQRGLAAVGAAIRGAASGAASAATSLGRSIVSGIGRGLAGVAGAVRAQLAKVKGAVTGAFSGASTWLLQAGRDIVAGLAHGITGQIHEAVSAAESLASSVKDKVHGVLKIGSPSKVMIKAGEDTAQGLADGIRKRQQAAIKAAQEMATKVIAAAHDPLAAGVDNLSTLLSHGFEAKQAAAATPAEQQLQAMQDARDKAQRDQALADAQAAQAAATTDEQRVAAAKDVADAVYAIQVAALQEQAAAERTALENQQYMQQRAFDSSLAGLQKYLNSGKATAASAQTQIDGFMKKWGVSLGDLGSLLGSSFANGIDSAATAVEQSAAKLKKVIDKAMANVARLKRAAGVGPSKGGGKAAPAAAGVAPAGLAAGTTAAGSSGGTLYGSSSPFAGIGRALQAAAAPAVQAVPMVVRVYIGDTELTDIVRTEVGYAGDETARLLLAGAR